MIVFDDEQCRSLNKCSVLLYIIELLTLNETVTVVLF